MPAEILVAEDNPLNFELLRDILTGAGHLVDWARDGEEALTRLRSRPFDLLLLDLHMPRLDGIQVLRAVRADPALAALRVVIVSADAMGNVAETVTTEGADAYLTKPVDITALLNEVERQMAGRQPGGN